MDFNPLMCLAGNSSSIIQGSREEQRRKRQRGGEEGRKGDQDRCMEGDAQVLVTLVYLALWDSRKKTLIELRLSSGKNGERPGAWARVEWAHLYLGGFLIAEDRARPRERKGSLSVRGCAVEVRWVWRALPLCGKQASGILDTTRTLLVKLKKINWYI